MSWLEMVADWKPHSSELGFCLETKERVGIVSRVESTYDLVQGTMNKLEARGLLAGFLLDLQKESYEQLAGLIGNPVCIGIEAGSGVTYQIEYEAFWDSEPDGMIRVIASIDDGRFLAVLSPVSMDFLIDSDGQILS